MSIGSHSDSTGTDTRPARAAGLMLAAMALIGLIDNFVARISESIGLWQFVAMRTALMAPMLLALSWLGLGRLRPRRWGPVLARSLAIAVSMFLYFGALGVMPISQTLAGLFTSPIFVLLINVSVQGQRIGPRRVLAVACGFLGVILVLQPGGDGLSLLSLMPVAAGFFYALAAVATRSWCAGESALALLAANMISLGVLAAAVLVGLTIWAPGFGQEITQAEASYLTRGWSWDIQSVLPWVLVQAAGSLLGVLLIIRAYQLDEASNVAVFEYSVMVYAPIYAWLLFGQTLSPQQMTGTALIILAGFVIALRAR